MGVGRGNKFPTGRASNVASNKGKLGKSVIVRTWGPSWGRYLRKNYAPKFKNGKCDRKKKKQGKVKREIAKGGKIRLKPWEGWADMKKRVSKKKGRKCTTEDLRNGETRKGVERKRARENGIKKW